VGFEIDKSVQAFDVVMLLAADLENVPPAPAAISLSATTANFRTSDGSTPVTILVTNSGGGTLSGLTATVSDATGQPTWTLEARLSSTTAPSLLTLSAFPYVATDGTYTATVAVASAGVSNSPQTVSVTFVVTGSPIANAIYVSESDPRAVDDATCGLLPGFIGGTPCRSIMHGLFRANTLNRPEVRVADGHYTETVALLNGKKLLGGYLPDTWQRHVATTNTIIDGVSSFGNHDQTVIASGITLPTVFEGFVVHGSVNTKTGGNSYAIYVAGGNGSLAIQSNLIYGGAGGPGAQGSAGAAGLQGSDGTGRNSNPVAYDALITSGTGQCDPSNNRVYSNGGPGSGVGNMSGGNGGGTLCPTTQGLRQLSAQNGDFAQFGGGLGIGGLDFRLESLGTICVAAATGSQDGGNGGPGGNGQSGAPGLGAATADGSIVGGHWIGAPGGSGATGSNGAGGGGGGAGGGAYSLSTAEDKDRLGAVGGGGGAGGSRGFGGGPGSAGGGAFGIFIAGTAPAISDNTIIRGTGGTGGGGGTGGAGGVGGDGGAGGVSSIFCTGSAGRGGKGGNGGAGSGGGGGAGGVSFGIFTSGAGTPNYCSSANNTISGGGAGIGGLGGQSLGNVGGAGASGAFGTCSFH
jgi:hypothetical protein